MATRARRRTEVEIRVAGKQDFETLWRIDQQCFPPRISYSRGELAVYMRGRGAFTLVAEAQGNIVGFLVAGTPRSRVGHIITIDLLPEARRQGIGKRLMELAEARLAAAGCAAITLETAVDNAGVLSFYNRLGYEVVGTIPRYYDQAVDAIVMRKVLSVSSQPAQ